MRREQLREEAGRPVLAGGVVSVRHMCGAAVACVSSTNAGPTGPGPTNGGRVPTADQLFRPDRERRSRQECEVYRADSCRLSGKKSVKPAWRETHAM
jgi:hypothetical protein